MLSIGVADALPERATEDNALSIGATMLEMPLIEADDRALWIGPMMLETDTESEADNALSIGAMRLEAPLIEADERMLCIGPIMLSAGATDELATDDNPPCVGNTIKLSNVDDGEGVSREPKPIDNMLPIELTGIGVLLKMMG